MTDGIKCELCGKFVPLKDGYQYVEYRSDNEYKDKTCDLCNDCFHNNIKLLEDKEE